MQLIVMSYISGEREKKPSITYYPLSHRVPVGKGSKRPTKEFYTLPNKVTKINEKKGIILCVYPRIRRIPQQSKRSKHRNLIRR